ncbi:hypothetical protein BpHYR1_051715 [Brachionus plicatilis]|uniref:Uncharacterized protein n=1 Tax=Brachionus plicatilis TaxID=10195 RepID=A0A3M7QKS1_BRAPC|nr:hypothetical protein BpHYR1_051715 [Brachionus plicatilis]
MSLNRSMEDGFRLEYYLGRMKRRKIMESKFLKRHVLKDSLLSSLFLISEIIELILELKKKGTTKISLLKLSRIIFFIFIIILFLNNFLLLDTKFCFPIGFNVKSLKS